MQGVYLRAAPMLDAGNPTAPPLHQRAALGHLGSAVVDRARGVTRRVIHLQFDDVGAKQLGLVRERREQMAKAMPLC